MSTETDKDKANANAEETKPTREKPVVVIPIYKDDAKKLGFEVTKKDPVQNALIRSKVRETLELPVRVRTSGIMAELKNKLKLKPDATRSEVEKAMRKKVLEN